MKHGTIGSYSRGKCRCAACVAANSEYQKQWRLSHPEHVRESSRKHHNTHKTERNLRARQKQWTRRGLNLTLEEWTEYLNEHGHQCEMPGCDQQDGLSPDHDHVTSELRGILCGVHNRALGMFGDDIEGLERAIAYLVMANRRRELCEPSSSMA